MKLITNVHQNVSDQKCESNDCPRNHFSIAFQGTESGNTIDVDVWYEVSDMAEKQDAEKVANLLAMAPKLLEALKLTDTYTRAPILPTQRFEAIQEIVSDMIKKLQS